jgi:antitoxin HigA-1
MAAVTEGIRMKNPAHPGGFVKTEIIEPLGLSVTGAADVLGITRAALSAFLNQRADLSPDMAIRLDKAFGVSMETLMRMQNSYDIAQAHKREGEIAGAVEPVLTSPFHLWLPKMAIAITFGTAGMPEGAAMTRFLGLDEQPG